MHKMARLAIVSLSVAFVLGVAGCGGGSTSEAIPPKSEANRGEGSHLVGLEAAKAAEAAKSADAAKPADATPAPAAPMDEKKPDSQTPVSTPAAPSAALDSKTIVGTKWSAAGYTLAFQDNGVVKINDDAEGTWKIDGNTLTIEAGGSEYKATLEGDKIMYEGSALEKL